MKQLKVPAIFSAIDKISGPMSKMERSTAAFATRTQVSMARAERSLRSFSNTTDTISSKIFNLRNSAVALFAAMAAKAGFDMVTNIAKTGDEAGKTARRLGLTAEALQEFQFAAKRQGVDQEGLIKSFEKLNKNVGDLQAGTGSLHTILQKTNPTLARQLRGVNSNEEAFKLITEAINKLPSPLQKASLAQAAFGRAGQEMLLLMENGTAGIDALREEVRGLGGILSNEAVQSAEDYMDAMENMEAAMLGVKLAVGSKLMPVIQSIVEKTTQWIVQNRELIAEKVEQFVSKVSDAIRWMYENGESLIATVKKVVIGLVALQAISLGLKAAMIGMAIATFLYNVGLGASAVLMKSVPIAVGQSKVALVAYKVVTAAVTAAQWLWNAAMAANPIGLIIVGIAALIGFIALVIAKWDSWGAAVSVFLGPIGLVISLIQSFRRNWDMIVQAFKTDGILGGLKAIGKTLLDAILQPLQQILEIAGKIPGKVGDMARSGAAKIEAFRTNMGVNMETGDAADGEAGATPAINPKAAEQDALIQRMEKTENKNVTLDFKNMPKGVEASGDGISGLMLPQLGSTLAF